MNKKNEGKVFLTLNDTGLIENQGEIIGDLGSEYLVVFFSFNTGEETETKLLDKRTNFLFFDTDEEMMKFYENNPQLVSLD
jgi:hypothetical protein